MHIRWFAMGAFGAVIVGCGLSLAGLEPDAVGSDGGGAPMGDGGAAIDGNAGDDAAGHVPVRDTGPDAPGSTCTASLGAGWSVTLYEEGREPCPSGTVSQRDGVAGGVASAAACPCSCSVTGPVGCETGTLRMTSGASIQSCAGSIATVDVSGELCSTLPSGLDLTEALSVLAPSPSGGCTAAVAPDPSQVTRNSARACAVSAGDAEGVCEGHAPAGFAACVAHTGDVACPPDTAFVHRSLVSEDVALACSACASCTLTASCGGGTVAFFADTACNGALVAVAADGNCNPTGAAGAHAAAVVYDATLVDAGACVASGSTPTLEPSGALTTVCCR